MNKIKMNKAGMTLVEVLVAMTLFTIMFMMIFGIMLYSTKMNAQTRNYDQEIDVHVEDAERYNPMAVTINGHSSTSTDVSAYPNASKSIDFKFSGNTITVGALAFQVNSKNENNAFTLKFFSSTRPDVAHNKYWVRIYNVTSDETENLKAYLYIPKDSEGSFYLKNGSEALSEKVVRTISPNTALAVGFDGSTVSGQDLFFVSTIDGERDDVVSQSVDTKTLIKITRANFIKYDADGDGYVDIYYCDDGFLSYDEYQEFLKNPKS